MQVSCVLYSIYEHIIFIMHILMFIKTHPGYICDIIFCTIKSKIICIIKRQKQKQQNVINDEDSMY